MDFFKKGLDGFQLKILALIFMTFDHIAYFLYGVFNIPTWFHIIGRISAPLFIFMVAQGVRHTRNRKKYMIRLYGASVMMGILNQLANTYFPHPEGAMVMNNIFATLFLITFFIAFGEKMVTAFKQKQVAKGLLNLGIILAPILLGMVPVLMMDQLPQSVIFIALTFIPTPLLVEGGIVWLALGIGFYLFSKTKKQIALFYSLFCTFVFYLTTGMDLSFANLFVLNVQWLMILALPFLLVYNVQKGKGMRNLFYIYYPAHIYILLGISHLLYALK